MKPSTTFEIVKVILFVGVVLPPDVHTTPESEEDPPSQDGVIAPPASARPISLLNRFEPLSGSPSPGLKPLAPQDKDPKPKITPNTSSADAPPSHKNWKYVPDHGPTGKGDRMNDGPKSVSFFQVPDSQPRLKKVIYGHPKGSRLWADCLHRK